MIKDQEKKRQKHRTDSPAPCLCPGDTTSPRRLGRSQSTTFALKLCRDRGVTRGTEDGTKRRARTELLQAKLVAVYG